VTRQTERPFQMQAPTHSGSATTSTIRRRGGDVLVADDWRQRVGHQPEPLNRLPMDGHDRCRGAGGAPRLRAVSTSHPVHSRPRGVPRRQVVVTAPNGSRPRVWAPTMANARRFVLLAMAMVITAPGFPREPSGAQRRARAAGSVHQRPSPTSTSATRRGTDPFACDASVAGPAGGLIWPRCETGGAIQLHG
jgi:hypothetical protein